MFQLPPGMSYQQFVAAGMPGYQSDTPGPGGFGRDVFTPPVFDPGMGGSGGNSAGGFAPGLMPPMQPGQPNYTGGQPSFGPSPSQGSPWGGGQPQSPWGGSSWGGQFGGFNPFGGAGSFGGNQFGGQPWGDALPVGGRAPMAGGSQPAAPYEPRVTGGYLPGYPANPRGGFDGDTPEPPANRGQQGVGNGSAVGGAPIHFSRPGQAQPIQPPAQGTPYGSQPLGGIGQRGGFGRPPAPQHQWAPNKEALAGLRQRFGANAAFE